MNCAAFDLRDYYFEALGAAEARQVREHLDGCGDCAAELERLRVTALTLSALTPEEIPRRIAFVSDKVFEPSLVLRWWQAFWLSGARMASASALLLAAAILVHAFRPVEEVRVIEKPASIPVAMTASADPAALQSAVDRAVAKAVAEVDARYDARLKRVTEENEKRRRQIIRAAEVFDAMDRQSRVNTVAMNRPLEGGQ